jgi:hypothetical protein
MLFPVMRRLVFEIVDNILVRNFGHDQFMEAISTTLLITIFIFAIVFLSTLKFINKFYNRKYYPEIIMFLLFFGISTLIFLRSYFYGVFISPDSTNYLRAAQSIVNGYGFNVYAEAGWKDFYFAHWPIGYPLLIAYVSLITGTDVYLASKILTILTLAGIFVLLYLKFKKEAWIYALIMSCYQSFLTVFYFTWSEQLYLLGSLLLTFEIINIVSKDKIKLYHYLNIFIACLLMFIVRYVGIQTIGIIVLIIIYFITIQISTKKSMLKKIIPLTIVGILVSIMSLYYFYMNYINTGYIGGSYIPSRGEVHNFKYIMMCAIDLCIGQMVEISYIFQINLAHNYRLLFVALILLFIIISQFKKQTIIKRSLDSFVYITMFLYFVLAFLFFRSTTETDTHYTRHLIVSTSLFSFWCITLFFESKNYIINKIKQFVQKKKVLIFCVFSIWFVINPLINYMECLWHFINGSNFLNQGPSVSYQQTKNEIMNELSSVPPKSIIIIAWGFSRESFANFMRPDSMVMGINQLTSIEKYPELLDKYDNVYLYLDTEYIISDLQIQVMQKNVLLRDHIYFRNNKLIKIK